ncbi:isocyanide synthase family protein [Patescibacteria group bacterium AH-259-L05]|nr:isocyanide synthase family protein [Patescibacteria group bacterium AH-259-L05]
MQEETQITNEWVRSGLLKAIHINYQKSTLNISPFKKLESKQVSLSLPEANPLQQQTKSLAPVDQILAIMLSKSVRRGKKALIEPFLNSIREKIQGIVDHQQPISFILPTLPFKDQSPFVTGASISHVDLGEYAFFAQIKRILNAVKEVYTPGAHMTLLCDGYIYADIFANGDKKGAGRYKARCEQIKNEYGLYNEVTCFDMREVLFDMPEWKHIETAIQEIVRKLYQTDPAAKERLDTLARRFIFHVAIPNHLYEEARIIYSSSPWPDWIWEKLLDSAIRYSALQLTLKKTELVKRAFPSAVRCTVHPKAAAQLPLHLTNPHNQLLPYNGAATISRQAQTQGQSLFQALRIKRLCDILEYDDVIAVYTENSKDPIYYEIP